MLTVVNHELVNSSGICAPLLSSLCTPRYGVRLKINNLLRRNLSCVHAGLWLWWKAIHARHFHLSSHRRQRPNTSTKESTNRTCNLRSGASHGASNRQKRFHLSIVWSDRRRFIVENRSNSGEKCAKITKTLNRWFRSFTFRMERNDSTPESESGSRRVKINVRRA